MRLLHSTTLELAEFNGQQIPPYAILSHTWGDGEVSFQDMQGRQAEKKEGIAKIRGCCSKAAADGFEYIWVDTCCIDKSSSSELSEAINSMWEWYRAADVCYVYLSDVPPHGNPQSLESDFSDSRWFTRGWTLQELIAPSSLIFFNADWHEIGTKLSLKEAICRITGIPKEILSGVDLEMVSTAQRMSWASKRQTSRLEDVAYCLMGIFKVNMPMLYGEGRRAFIRLQEEIMKSSTDQTIFAWESTDWYDQHGGLLATSPAAFQTCGSIVRRANSPWFANPLSMTSEGVHLRLPLEPIGVKERDQTHFLAILDCIEKDKKDSSICIQLEKLLDGRSSGSLTAARYVRANSHKLSSVLTKLRRAEEIYVKQSHRQDKPSSVSQGRIKLTDNLQQQGISVREVYSDHEIRINSRGAEFAIPIDKYAPFMVVRFAGVQQIGFTITLLNSRHGISANIEAFLENSELRTLEDICRSFYGSTYRGLPRKPTRTWVETPDRFCWRLPSTNDSISITIKRQATDGERIQVVEVDYVGVK